MQSSGEEKFQCVCIVCPPYPQVPLLQIQPTENISRQKIFQKRKCFLVADVDSVVRHLTTMVASKLNVPRLLFLVMIH